MSKFKINVFAATNVGRVRKHNEDFVGFHKPTHKEREEEYGTIMVVADGVGGSAKGEVASRIAVEQTIRNYYNLPKSLSPDKRLKKAIELANSAVIKKAREIRAEGMATTLTAAVVINNTAFIANVGDSRTYIINPNRPEKIKQITLDHSLVEEQVRRGLLTKEEAERAPNKNVITRAIGMDSFVSVDLFKVKLMEGDKLLLCSDGLVKVVRDKEIYRIVSTKKNIEESVDTLIKLANARGGPDNITVCIGEVRNAKKASALVPVLTGAVAIALILLMALPIFPPKNVKEISLGKDFTPNQIYWSSDVINNNGGKNSGDSNSIIVIDPSQNIGKELNIDTSHPSLVSVDEFNIKNLKFYIDANNVVHFNNTAKNFYNTKKNNVDNVLEIQFLYHITEEYLALTKDSKLEIIESNGAEKPLEVDAGKKRNSDTEGKFIAFAVQDPSTIYVLNANGDILHGSLKDAEENTALTLEDKLGKLLYSSSNKVSLFSNIINTHRFYINEPITNIQSMLADNTTGNLYLLGHEHIYELPGVLKSVNIKVANNTSLASYGSLSVSSNPSGAEIYIDGKDTEKQTPQTINNIEVGKHTITLKKEEYKTFLGPFTITKDNTKTINRTLIPVSSNAEKNNNANKSGTATFSISSTPQGAEVYIDGKDTEKQTPQTINNIEVGKHTITLKKEGYKTYTTTITFQNGKEYQVIASLIPVSEKKETKPKVTTATLSISSNPQGAEIYIDGKDAGKQTPQTFTLSQGKHTIELWRTGYKEYVVSIDVLPGKLNNINATLTKSPPLISISSSPKSAEIYIDGNHTKYITPHSFWIIAPGKHTITLKLKGYKDYTKVVTITENKTTNVSATLLVIMPCTWKKMNNGLTNTDVRSLAIDPKNTQIIYTGTWDVDGGVFKSIDGGVQWKEMNNGLTNPVVQILVIDPKNTQIIYAGTGGGVFKSTDGGAHWKKMNTGLANINVRSLAIDPINPQIIYAGTKGGVFKSTDGGAHWKKMNNGLTDTYVLSLAIDPANTKTVYVGTYGGGVFKSTDGGAHWSKANNGLTGTRVYSLAIDPINPQIIYAGTKGGVFKSTDGGTSWESIGLATNDVYSLAIDPANTKTVYAGTGGGVFKSTDGGAHWTKMNNGLTDTKVSSLAIDPKNTQIIYAGTRGGVFKYVCTFP